MLALASVLMLLYIWVFAVCVASVLILLYIWVFAVCVALLLYYIYRSMRTLDSYIQQDHDARLILLYVCVPLHHTHTVVWIKIVELDAYCCMCVFLYCFDSYYCLCVFDSYYCMCVFYSYYCMCVFDSYYCMCVFLSTSTKRTSTNALMLHI